MFLMVFKGILRGSKDHIVYIINAKSRDSAKLLRDCKFESEQCQSHPWPGVHENKIGCVFCVGGMANSISSITVTLADLGSL